MPTQQELLDFSRFDINAILRGAQLTFVGAQRALQNPGLWTTQHYRQAATAVACGIAIRLLIEIPVISVKVALWFLSWFVALDTVTWDDAISDGLRFLQEYVLQVPLFMMTLMRHITPAMDELFMSSLAWVDYTYAQKHAADHGHDSQQKGVALADPRNRYFENLQNYAQVSAKYKPSTSSASSPTGSLSPGQKGIVRFLWRFGRKAGISLAVFALSYVPVVGRLVLPATSFLTFRHSVGLGPASLIFGLGLFLPRRYLVVFLQTYYGSRSLVRELLGPYFSRMHFTASQKRNWFSSREGLLFGFGAGFYILLRVPLVGVLIYGIAEASAAYLVTKITDPPPSRADFVAVTTGGNAAGAGALVNSFNESQQTWRNRKAFLDLALDNLDALQHKRIADQEKRAAGAAAGAASSSSPSSTSAYEKAGQGSSAQQRIVPPTIPGEAPPPYTN